MARLLPFFGGGPPGPSRRPRKSFFVRLSFLVLFFFLLAHGSIAGESNSKDALRDDQLSEAIGAVEVGNELGAASEMATAPLASASAGYRLNTRGRTAEKEQLTTSKGKLGMMLLLCGVLALYGTARWVQAGEVAGEARSAAAARREELQDSLNLYEQKMRENVLLTKKLSEEKDEAAKTQAQVKAAAKEAEKAERELIALLTKQAQGGEGLAQLLGTLTKTAEGLEEEARTLEARLDAAEAIRKKRQIKEGSLVAQAYEQQKELAQLKRQVLEKLARQSLLEARWGEALKTSGKTILEEIEKNAKELEALNMRRAELRREKAYNVARPEEGALSVKYEEKQKLEEEIAALKEKLKEKKAENAKKAVALEEQQGVLEDKEKELEKLREKVEEAKVKRDKLAEEFEKKRKEFAEKMSPLEGKLAELGKHPSCLAGVCKKTEDKLSKKKEEIKAQGLIDDALRAHKELMEFEQQAADGVVAERRKELRKKLVEVQQRLKEEDLDPLEKAILEQKQELLTSDIANAAAKALEDAHGSEIDRFLTLETTCIIRHKSHLAIFGHFDDAIDDDLDNEELQQQMVRSQIAYERNREHLMLMMDLASTIVESKSFGKEIKGLYKDKKTVETLVAEEKERLENLLEETKKRLNLTTKRYTRARRGLQWCRNHNNATRDPNQTANIILKRRLLLERASRNYYIGRISRLEKRLQNVETEYKDKLMMAKDIWNDLTKEYSSQASRFHAAGATNSALAARKTSEADLQQIEDFDEEDEDELKDEENLADTADDPSLSDDDLLNLKPLTEYGLKDLIKEAKMEAESTGEAEGSDEPEESSNDESEEGDESAKKGSERRKHLKGKEAEQREGEGAQGGETVERSVAEGGKEASEEEGSEEDEDSEEE